jgi:NAD(P)-dependent dehydrogenase (short-subunit alcohol dehydrogenase family)
MEGNGIKFRRYFKEYKVKNVMAMVRNNGKKPLVCDEDCHGKLVVVTGATSGIGYETAKKFASMGADLICINRNREKSDALKEEIEKEYRVGCRIILADLSSMADTFRAARELLALETPIDVLVHNAGIYLTKKQMTEDGIEIVFMVNHLSSFLINNMLKEKLKGEGKCRIILVNSEGHRFAAWGMRLDDLSYSKQRYSGLGSYGRAKLSQLLSMMKFDEFYKDSGVTINAMHPGAVKSATGQDNGKLYKWFKKNSLDKALKPTSMGAEAIYYLGTAPEMDKISGKFFNLTTQEEPAPPALDRETADALWDLCVDLVNQHDQEK